MPKGAPGQPRKPGAGRPRKAPGTQYVRVTVRISRKAADYIKQSGNASETIEQLAREKMASKIGSVCPICGEDCNSAHFVEKHNEKIKRVSVQRAGEATPTNGIVQYYEMTGADGKEYYYPVSRKELMLTNGCINSKP